MDEHAVLGPIDPQIDQLPAVSLLSVVEKKPIERVEDRTLILADVARKAIAQTRQGVLELLEGSMEPAKAEEIAAKLTSGIWTHDYPLGCKEAMELGLPIVCNLPREIYRMMNLYPQPMRKSPSVEYLPWPRRDGPRPLPPRH